MAGDVRLGAVLEELRTARGLTLAAVARQVRCSLSLLSYVESGQRALQPWLAEALDRIYRTGSVVASLARGAGSTPQDNPASGVPKTDVFVVQLPQGGVAMPLSRREVLAALGLGIVTGSLQAELERALDGVDLNSDVLRYFENAFGGFQEAARILPPSRLIDGMMGNVAILDGLRRRATDIETGDRHRSVPLQHAAGPLRGIAELVERRGGRFAGSGVVERPGVAVGAGRWMAGDDCVRLCPAGDDGREIFD